MIDIYRIKNRMKKLNDYADGECSCGHQEGEMVEDKEKCSYCVAVRALNEIGEIRDTALMQILNQSNTNL